MKKKLIGFLLCLLIIATSIPAGGQMNHISIGKDNDEIYSPSNRGTWIKLFSFSYFDEFRSVKQTSDGGFIIGGTTQEQYSEYYDILLAKTNCNGRLMWSRIFGGPDEEDCIKVEETSDGKYILLGTTSSYGEKKGTYTWVIKTDSKGNTLWDKKYLVGNGDYAYDIQQTNDGGYFLACGLILIKIDENGEIEWNKTYDNSVFSIAQVSDGNYSAMGNIEFLTWLFKIDINGEVIWEKKFGNDSEGAFFMESTDDGGNILCGLTFNPELQFENILLIKTDSYGEIMWKKIYDLGGDHLCLEVQQTYDRGYIITGMYFNGSSLIMYPFLIKTNQNGEIEWIKRYTSLLYQNLFICSGKQTTDGGYILAGFKFLGFFGSVGFLMKTNDKGNVLRSKVINHSFQNWLQSHPNLLSILQKLFFLTNPKEKSPTFKLWDELHVDYT